MKIDQWIFLEEVDSTSDWLKREYRNYRSESVVVCARIQNSGRGQYDRQWLSLQGGLYFSMLLRPNFSIASPEKVLLSFPEFFCRFCWKNFRLQLRIKPPNDVYFEDRKLMGVLIENSFLGNTLEYCILGVGINLKQSFAKELEFKPVTLRELGIEVSDSSLFLQSLIQEWQPDFLLP